jgi:holo-[acyl-carrier protein] synthase
MSGIKLGALCISNGYDEIVNLINQYELFMSNETYHKGVTSNNTGYIIFDETPINNTYSLKILEKFKNMLDGISNNLPYFSVFNTYLIKAKRDNWQELLTEDEINVLNDYRNDKSKLEFIAGRGLLKLLIIAYHSKINGADLSPKDLTIIRDESGKPQLMIENNNKNQYKVCISHKDDYIFCGFHSVKKFGLDVEKIDMRLEKVKKYYIDHEEDGLIRARAGSITEYLENLAKVWASKESLVKYNGSKLLSTASTTKLRSMDGNTFRLNIPVKNKKTDKIMKSYNHNFDRHVFTVVI